MKLTFIGYPMLCCLMCYLDQTVGVENQVRSCTSVKAGNDPSAELQLAIYKGTNKWLTGRDGVKNFLPFVCDGCTKIFCLEHKFPDKHSCSREYVISSTKKYDGIKSYKCCHGDCDSKELMPVVCEKCDLNFCLSHRHPQEHRCKNLEIKVDKCQTALHVQKILDAKPSKPVSKKPRKASKTAAKVALMKMKMKASGEKGTPETEKVYVLIYLPNDAKLAAKPIYFSKTWSVGRCIDYCAESVQLKNENNTGSEKKLRLFSHESGQLLSTEKSLEVLMTEEVIFSGSSVILEYVTSDVIQLDNTDDYKT